MTTGARKAADKWGLLWEKRSYCNTRQQVYQDLNWNVNTGRHICYLYCFQDLFHKGCWKLQTRSDSEDTSAVFLPVHSQFSPLFFTHFLPRWCSGIRASVHCSHISFSSQHLIHKDNFYHQKPNSFCYHPPMSTVVGVLHKTQGYSNNTRVPTRGVYPFLQSRIPQELSYEDLLPIPLVENTNLWPGLWQRWNEAPFPGKRRFICAMTRFDWVQNWGNSPGIRSQDHCARTSDQRAFFQQKLLF